MAATYRTSAVGGGTSGTSNRTCVITPAVGDLFIVFCAASGNTNAAPTCSDNNGGSYALIGTALFGTSANIVSVFVRTSLLANTTSTTVTVATGSNTAAEIITVAYSGMSRTGSAAVRSSGSQANQASGTPAPALNQSALTGNPTLTFYGAVGTAGLTAPTGWTSRQSAGQTSPSTWSQGCTRDSGFTGTTITWGSSSSVAFASFAIELDSSDTGVLTKTLGAATTASAGTVLNTGAASPTLGAMTIAATNLVDPTKFSWSSYFRHFAGLPWAETASAGASGTNSTITSAGAGSDPTAGTAIGGYNPATFASTDYVNHGDRGSTLFATSAGTIVGVFKASSLAAPNADYTKNAAIWSDTGNNFALNVDSSQVTGTVNRDAGTAGWGTVHTSTPLDTTNYHAVMLRWGSGTIGITVDGGTEVTNSFSSTGIDLSWPVQLGRDAVGTTYLQGDLLEAGTSTTRFADATWTDFRTYLRQTYGITGASVISGTLTKTLGALTSSAAGTNLDHGAASKTLGAMTSASAGTVLDTGAVAKTLGVLTTSAAGGVRVAGAASDALGSLALASTGTVGAAAAHGTASITLGALTDASAGANLDHGSLAKTLGVLTTTSAGTDLDHGALAKTLGALTTSSAGTVLDHGTATRTLGALTSASGGTVLDHGSLAKTLGLATVASAGTSLDHGALSKTLGVLSTASAGTVADHGALAKTLGALTSSAAGTVISGHTGNVNVTLGALASSSAGTVLDHGAAAKTLGILALAASVAVLDQGAVSRQLGALTASAAGSVLDRGAEARTLGALTLSAAGTLSAAPAHGSAAISLGSASVVSTGAVRDAGAEGTLLGALSLVSTVSTGALRSATCAVTFGSLLSAGRAVAGDRVAGACRTYLLRLTSFAGEVTDATALSTTAAEATGCATEIVEGAAFTTRISEGTVFYTERHMNLFVGDVAKIKTRITVDDVATDPSALTFTVKDPAGVSTTYTYGTSAEITRTAKGEFIALIPCTLSGVHQFRWYSPGPIAQGSDQGFYSVSPQNV